MRALSRRLRGALALPLLLAAITAAAYLVGQAAQRRALHAQAVQAQEQLQLQRAALQSLIDRYRALPLILALDAELQAALAAPMTEPVRAALNRKLEQVNDPADASTLTVLDRNGIAVAASNWRTPGSNVGRDYGFRPYFRDAVADGSARFYAVGLTTHVPGYFLSEALRDANGTLLGVVVVKLEIAELEQRWSAQRDAVVLLSDRNGIVFLASAPAWRYRQLRPLDAGVRAELQRTQQYADQELRPLTWRELPLDAEGRRVRIDDEPLAGRYLWLSQELPAEQWTLHLLRDTRSAVAAGRLAALAAAAVLAALLLLGLFLQQRLRLSRLRQRSRRELEELVRQHALALRTARDGVVQAAENAALGRSSSLEHLPQGVSVVDADLRLIAWNRRYVEILRYPPELVRVGRPIEDLLRHNARRGLLGKGDPEEAVQRRLEHMRAATPYSVEREWDDGTVIEIRGNPLPGGGFVTSYADITGYRNSARELRSLAGALERRIEDRTRDLDAARREAERANRSKTRFVAAAVHDLLQPLNAARLFTSALRARLQRGAGESQPLIDSIDEALAAQDAVLSSLLDISRLESGTIETEVRNIELQAMFEALRREFQLSAQARGLRLRCVPTRALARSDEALLRRILRNLLSNAIRYTTRGSVLLGCRRAGDRVRIEVWDTGCGIPESLHEEIFEEFRRLDGGPQQQDRGAGLGLAIVDRIARRLGHRLGLRSWPGRGSVFWLELPRADRADAPAVAALAAPEEGQALQHRKVWCIDDDSRVREGSRALLESWGCRVTLIASGDAALAACERGAAPDLLLLDQRLGDQLGSELWPRLCERWGSSPPTIVISAERDAALLAWAREHGHGFLPKPVKAPALRALMRQMLLRAGAG